jgi:hypothetical protein
MVNQFLTKRLVALLPLALIIAAASAVQAQLIPPGKADERSEQVIARAIAALGGDRYLKVTSVVSNGNFTQYLEGQAGTFYSFIDYILYPDHERTEFKTNGVRNVQTNTGQTGWLYDGQANAIRDMKPDQVQDFQWFVVRTSVENLLRGGWRTTGATVKHLGRRQAGLGIRNDALRLLYPDGFTVEFEFNAEGFPAKVIYLRKDGQGEEAKEEDRLAQWVDVDGIHAPFIVDHYRGGIQMSRVNYKTVEFNKPLAAALFTRPANVKAVK